MRSTVFIIPAAATAMLVAVAPAAAQLDVIQAHDYNFAADELNKEKEILAGLDKEIGQTTELVKGCSLLNQKLVHLKTSDTQLDKMIESAHLLKRRKEEENAVKLKKTTGTSIDTTQSDITRMCASLPNNGA
ncbi:MAG: hypothetical protein P0Y56_06580 [Candidatus Andeanibacterium colombiense]|uniref:Uncharacterized protein n=1 Tax=Candidatus Andeanibacterium colombiense TaxID=3121345 RepID=A0AAJ5X9A9_9SPHN|nr:MAG: hypothetical protein P0Y56_06580 [Sphingomonadaceae bacterium]